MECETLDMMLTDRCKIPLDFCPGTNRVLTRIGMFLNTITHGTESDQPTELCMWDTECLRLDRYNGGNRNHRPPGRPRHCHLLRLHLRTENMALLPDLPDRQHLGLCTQHLHPEEDSAAL